MITIRKTKNSVILSHNGNENILTEDDDLFFDSTSLYIFLQDRDVINEGDPPYRYCKGIVYNEFRDVYCIYNDEFGEWLLGDNTWTKDRYDKKIAFFKERIENLPSNCINQTRKVSPAKEHLIK